MARLTASIEVRGLQALDEAFRELPEDVAGPIMEAALRAGGELIREAAAGNITSRSGRTAADLRVEVQVDAGDAAGAAAVGGTFTGKTGRAHVLRWLEFGTKAHRIVAGETDRKEARRAARALRRIGDTAAAAALRARIRQGRIGASRALKLPGNVFRRSAKHPGIAPQSPLTRALAEQGDRAIKVFADTLWRGIVAASARLRRAA